MKTKLLTIGLVSAALIVAQVNPASAHDDHHWDHGGYHHGGDPVVGLIGAGAALVGAAAFLATAPVRMVANAAAPPPVYGQPAYAAPAAVYAPPMPVAYAPPPVYAAPVMPAPYMAYGYAPYPYYHYGSHNHYGYDYHHGYGYHHG